MLRSQWFWFLVFCAINITVCALLLLNFYSEEPQVEKLALEAACAGRTTGCKPVLRSFQRTPLARTWDYNIDPKTYVSVVCRRSYLLLGDYACTRSP